MAPPSAHGEITVAEWLHQRLFAISNLNSKGLGMAFKGRGRPATFEYQDRKRFADLMRIHGAPPTSEISEPTISLGTLLKIAREFEVELKKGRRPKRAA